MSSNQCNHDIDYWQTCETFSNVDGGLNLVSIDAVTHEEHWKVHSNHYHERPHVHHSILLRMLHCPVYTWKDRMNAEGERIAGESASQAQDVGVDDGCLGLELWRVCKSNCDDDNLQGECEQGVENAHPRNFTECLQENMQ